MLSLLHARLMAICNQLHCEAAFDPAAPGHLALLEGLSNQAVTIIGALKSVNNIDAGLTTTYNRYTRVVKEGAQDGVRGRGRLWADGRNKLRERG